VADIVQTFRTRFVEARFISLAVAIGVLAMRLLLFYLHGIPEIYFPDTGFLWHYFSPFFANPMVSFVSGTVAVFIIAALIAHLNNRFSLIRSRTNLPFIVPLVLFSLHPYFLAMTPDFVAIALLLTAVPSLMQSYQQPDTQLHSFRAAILIGTAGLFQLYALLLLPIWWRGEVLMRGVQLKSFFTSIFGVFLVYLSVFSVYFLFGNVQDFLTPFLRFSDISFPNIYYFTTIQWAGVASVFIFFLFYITLCLNMSVRVKVLTYSVTKFAISVITLFFIFQIVYWNETKFFFLMNIALIAYLIAYFHSISISRAHVFCAYIVMMLLLVFYFLNCFAF
jgi:hypothetical protein